MIFSGYDDFEQALASATRDAPDGSSVVGFAEHATTATLSQFDPEEARVTEQLKVDAPALRARDQGKFERIERVIGEALHERYDCADAIRIRLKAIIIAGVLRVALEGWVKATDEGVGTAAHLRNVVLHLHRARS